MRSYVISTDSSADLSEAYLKEHQITMISLSCILNGETYNSENPITPKQLYDNIREGAMPTTSQVNPEQAKAAFEPLLKEGKDILHLAFSSGLSGSCQSARIAAEELQDEYPERKIVVIDTLLAALGQGLLVYKAVQMKEQGASMDEVADWCEKNMKYNNHRFIFLQTNTSSVSNTISTDCYASLPQSSSHSESADLLRKSLLPHVCRFQKDRWWQRRYDATISINSLFISLRPA